MKLEYAKEIVNYGGDSLRLHEDYSGRGMYGKTTAGVSGDAYAYYDALKELICDKLQEAVYDAQKYADDFDCDEAVKELETLLDNTLISAGDSMGMGVIFY